MGWKMTASSINLSVDGIRPLFSFASTGVPQFPLGYLSQSPASTVN